jgi:hypothetical protein
MRALTTAALILAVSAGAFAQTAESDKWKFEISPYFWFAGLSGDFKSSQFPIEIPVDVPVGDVLSNLDGAFSIVGEARKDVYGVGAGYMFFSVEVEEPVNEVISVFSSAKMSLWDVWGFYTVPINEKGSRLDLIAGARGYTVEGGAGLGIGDTTLTVEGKANWVDPLFGFRVIGAFNDKWSANATADFGGFGVGSNISVNALAAINFRAIDLLSVKAGYRILYMDYVEGAGPTRFVWNITAQGPLVALTFHL